MKQPLPNFRYFKSSDASEGGLGQRRRLMEARDFQVSPKILLCLKYFMVLRDKENNNCRL